MEDKKNNRLKNNFFSKIGNKYILQKIFANLTLKILLQIIKYNKSIQEKLEKDINDYIKYYKKIIIEIIPIKKEEDKKSIDENSRDDEEDENSREDEEDENSRDDEEDENSKDEKKKDYFINYEEEDNQYYHIYFNDEKEEKYRTYFIKDENVIKIKIIIDEQITSFEKLFNCCDCIEKINFIKFNRIDINNMSDMFYGCSSLKELNLNNFNTINVTDMFGMFSGCSLLQELNLKTFNTINVTNMRSMFLGCSDELKKKIYYQNPNIKDGAFRQIKIIE